MTKEQKNQIAELRAGGLSYAKIGEKLSISKDTVKTYCRRNPTPVSPDSAPQENFPDICRQCGKPIAQEEKKKPRLFCSKECREQWWHSHPEQIRQRAVYQFVCPGCGMPFTAYGNKGRKYCSHSCYINARFKGGESHE